MRLTITNHQQYKVGVNSDIGILPGASVSEFELTLAQLEAVREKLTSLQNAGIITWTTSSSPNVDDQGEGATISLPQTTKVPNPSAPITSGTIAARTLTALGPIIFEPIADCVIDVPGVGATAWDTTQSAVIRVYKGTRALFGITASVANDPTWTSPAGLGQDYWLPMSGDQASSAWDIIIDGPRKTFRVMALPWGLIEPMVSAPTASPGDTLDLFAGGTFTGHTITGAGGASTYQIGAPTSDGSAFIAAGVADTRRLQDLGDGNGQRLLMECARINYCLQSETIFTGGAITAPWVAINGNTTGLGQQAGSPRGDATVTNLIMAADATTGVKQAITGVTSVEQIMMFSVWVRCAAGTEKIRLQCLLKDGVSVRDSGDVVVTPTWQRIILFIPNIGNFGGASSCEFRLVNGTDGLARTVQVWGCQAEAASNVAAGSGSTSYIKTVAVSVTRSGDFLWYASGTYPASFSTRGVSFTWMPEGSSTEFFSAGFQTLLAFNNNAPTQQDNHVVLDGIGFRAFASTFATADLGGRWTVGAGDAYTSISTVSGVPGVPRQWTETVTWGRRTLLTITAEAYRGALRIQGALTGNRRYTLGGGPWVWGGGGIMTINGTAGIAGALPQTGVGGSFGRYLTAA